MRRILKKKSRHEQLVATYAELMKRFSNVREVREEK